MTSRLATLLSPHEQELLRLRHRWYAIEVFLTELRNVTRGRPFEIHDRAAWNWMIDAQAMLTVRVQGWVEQILDQGSFFDTVLSSPTLLVELRAKYPADEEHAPSHRIHRMQTLQERFGGAIDEVDREQLEGLASSVRQYLAPIAFDADDAEVSPPANAAINAVQLHRDTDEQLRYAEHLCSDLRLCSGAPPNQASPVPAKLPTTPARALIDAILLGGSDSIDKIDRPEIIQGTPAREDRRQRAYAALHTASPNPKAPFNTEADLATVLGLWEDEDEP